ncbi:choice-of-anchor M domain-containing protein [Paludisphaera sp.]|uniref:choice-of-anchor M domain-containing protein n=1 Tax=Paludisphaera sp. TaxID=2017432 RepID=UPI00301B93B8
MKTHLSKIAGAFALAAAVATAAPSARAGFDDNLYQWGHADIQVGYDGTSLGLSYKLAGTAGVNGSPVGGSGAEFGPADLSVVVPELALGTGHASLPSPFAGAPLYLINQNAQGSATRPFLGFGAEGIGPGLFVGDELSISLTGFSTTADGGQFVLFQNGFWSSPAMNSADGFSDDTISVYPLGHDHYNWGFTAAGVYDLVFTATGMPIGGTELTTTATFRFVVGDQPAAVPEPSALAMAGLAVGCGALVAARRRRA